MTTIAFKNGVMAADRQVTGADTILGYQTKIRKIGNKLVGATGSTPLARRFFEWVAAGCEGEPPPMIYKPVADEFSATGIIVEQSGVTMFGEPGIWTIDLGVHAWGSGMDFAWGAMSFGATAEEAIHVASRHCTGTGGGVDTIRFD